MKHAIAPLVICFALGFGSAQLKLSPTALRAQGPALPQGAALPGPPRASMPPRDGTAAEAPTGTGRIRGRVVAADTGAPLRRAQVRLSAAELRVNRSATTDAEGRYEFPELPAGRYSVSVSRSGFVSLSFGQQRPFEQGRPLDLGLGQDADKIDFALPRGGVIAGRVTDELGEPLAGVRVQAMRYQYLPNGRRQLTPVGGGGIFGGPVTNDLGEFRLYSLMPGTYVVSATPADGMMMMAGPAAPASATSQDDGHGITYYPGTINVDEAQSITVGLADVANASFALVPQRMTRISGIVRNSQGKPFAASLSLRTQSGGGDVDARACDVGVRWPVQRFQCAARRALHRNFLSHGRRGVRVGADYGRRPGHHRPHHHDGSRHNDLRAGYFRRRGRQPRNRSVSSHHRRTRAGQAPHASTTILRGSSTRKDDSASEDSRGVRCSAPDPPRLCRERRDGL